MDQLDNSIDDFSKALQIDPNHYNAAYSRGACENRRGNFVKAIEDYNLALEKDQRTLQAPRAIPLANVNYILDSYCG
jgi:tetratricopeptide (TPR) repeat protein